MREGAIDELTRLWTGNGIVENLELGSLLGIVRATALDHATGFGRWCSLDDPLGHGPFPVRRCVHGMSSLGPASRSCAMARRIRRRADWIRYLTVLSEVSVNS